MNKRNSPQWISHRGYYKHQVENTLGAFDEAVNLRFDRLETDLRVTKDDHLVLCHDTSFTRVGGPKEDVWTMTRNEVQASFLKYHTKALFFEDFCNRYATADWVLDIKPEQAEKTIAALKDWAEYNKAHDLLTRQAMFLFWDKAHEKLLLDFLPNATILADAKRCWRAGLSLYVGMSFLGGFKKGMTYSLIPKLGGKNFFTKKIVDKIHARGAKALAYLPETEKLTKEAVEAGFDYILTEDPPLRRTWSSGTRTHTSKRPSSGGRFSPSRPSSSGGRPSPHRNSSNRPSSNRPSSGRPSSSRPSTSGPRKPFKKKERR